MGNEPWQLELARPLWLVALAALPLLIFYWHWGLVQFSRWQQILSLITRATTVTIVVVALAGLEIRSVVHQRKIIPTPEKPKVEEPPPVVVPPPKPRVLVIENRPERCERLIQALRKAPFEVEVGTPETIPETVDNIKRFDLLILSDIPASALNSPRMGTVRQYVEGTGGGLIVIGGEHSFIPGGYRHTTLEDILPVISEPTHVRPKPSLAMVLILDRSGSMEGEALKLAKQAARQAVELLGPRDQVGILAFQDVAEWACEIHPCSDKATVFKRIDAIEAGGGTNMYPAMQRAYFALDEISADLKHVILLTDGASNPADFEGLAREMAKKRITVSTVGAGPGVVRPLLEDIAREGKGNHYFCESASTLPKVFVQETTAAGKEGVFEGKTSVKWIPSEAIFTGLDVNKLPPLTGYMESRLNAAAELLLETGEESPLLAWRQCGKGKSMAFLSDVQGHWTSAWLQSDIFDAFWIEMARYAMRDSSASSDRILKTNRPKDLDILSKNKEPTGAINESQSRLSDLRKDQEPLSIITVVSVRCSLWSFLLGIALIMLVGELALKRISLSRFSK